MDERPLDPARVYLLKHTTRTVTAEVDHGLVLNQIGIGDRLHGAADHLRSLRREPRHGQLHPDRSGDELHGGRRHDCRGGARSGSARRRTAERGRAAGARWRERRRSDAEAIEAVRKALEELLS